MELQDFNKSIIDEFRTNNGVVGGQFAGAPLLLLTTTGAKSGLSRVNPLAYLADKNRHVIIASYAGGPTNPPWYHNLIANPEVYVEVGSDSFRAKAEVLSEPERSELYKKIADAMPAFAEYQTKTTRVIPVIALSRTD
ncbi:MAG: nitroreductase family deazaflavin-dependent oxidoreductase [Gammaproteobacteria bacterium]|nr:nitroreductase family deazaflavin-dependent oxidoreductase [Gammaproteobacteria bacterium]